ncbi:MAG: hypothetical protein KJO32_05710, partial [Deltaproteobacteria bacterium]|nr:hypothetical protein [Deltaproteobacteria bacterium]
NRAMLRALPERNMQDIYVDANNNYMLSYDNTSGIKQSTSNALCQTATSGGHASRAHYTNADEFVVDVMRPVMINGLAEAAARQDLIDRLIQVELQRIDRATVVPESVLMARFEAERPIILGALYDLSCRVQQELSTMNVTELPRMADFGLLCEAITKVYGWNHSLLDVYNNNRKGAMLGAMDDERIIGILLKWKQCIRLPIEMTMKELLLGLKAYGGQGKITDGWESLSDEEMDMTPRKFGGKLREQQEALKEAGCLVEFLGKRRGHSIVRISRP